MFKKSVIFLVFVLFLMACHSNGSKRSEGIEESFGQPCGVRIEITSKSEHVELYVYVQGEEKSLTIDKVLDLSTQSKEVIDLSSSVGAALNIEVKTNDSYGPEVDVQVFLNNQLYIQESDNYKISIEEKLNLPPAPKGV